MRNNKAVFLDRDGVINELIYYRETGMIDSPFTPKQIKLIPKVEKAIKRLKNAGFKILVVSNQPGIAKGHFTKADLDKMTYRLNTLLTRKGAYLDQIYYCLHHPKAKVKSFRKNCFCRKPKPGLLKRAAHDFNINLKNSCLIGDDLSDIKAGKEVGCKTFLIGSTRCGHCRVRQEKKIEPDFIVSDLYEAAEAIIKEEA